MTQSRTAVEAVVNELVSVGFANMADYATWGDLEGLHLFESETLTRSQKAAVASISEKSTTHTDAEGNTTVRRHLEFRLHSKLDALGRLSKYLDLAGQGLISWPAMLEVLVSMAQIVEEYVSDEETLAHIKAAWSRLEIRPQRVAGAA